MIVAQSNQSSQQLQASAATSMRNWNKNTNKKGSSGESQNWKTTMMLTNKKRTG